MSTDMVPQIAQALQTILGPDADQLAQATGFVQRRVKVTGANFCQTLIFGWLHQPEATLEALCGVGAAVGLDITPQGLEQRFTPAAAALLAGVLRQMVQTAVAAEPVAIPLLQRFGQVVIEDSSVVTLPDELASQWSGCGGSGSASGAAVKLQVRWDMVSGQLDGPHLLPGRVHDRQAALQHPPLPPGALHIADPGYWSLDRLQALSQQQVSWLSRLQARTSLWLPTGERMAPAAFLGQCQENQVELAVCPGAQHRLPARLLAIRVPAAVARERRRKLKAAAKREGLTVSRERLLLAEWTMLVTTVPPEQLSLAEALVLMRLRWQIELLFKLWKDVGRLDESRSQQPWRVLTEFYAKLAGLLIQHWCCLTSLWCFPDRSLTKAARTVQSHALSLAMALPDRYYPGQALDALMRCLAHGARINKSRKTPGTFQLLLAQEAFLA